MCQCTRGGLSSASACMLSGWSINPFSCSSPLQTCENSGSFLSCSLALAMILTSESRDGNCCHLTLLCPSTQSDAWQRLNGSQSFSLQQTGGNRREKGQGVSLPLFGSGLLSACCVSKETVFQGFCLDFTEISSLTAFLPWAWMPAGSPLTSTCGISKQISTWETAHDLQQGAGSGVGTAEWIERSVPKAGQEGYLPLGKASPVFSLWLKQCFCSILSECWKWQTEMKILG